MAAINHPLGRSRRLPLPAPSGSQGFWLYLVIGLTALSALLPVAQNSLATSTGFDTQAFQRREAELNGQISLLESDVASLTSMNRIERRAKEIGLGPVADPIYLSVTEPGPAPAKLPAEYLPPATQVAEPLEPWWKPLFSWLP